MVPGTSIPPAAIEPLEAIIVKIQEPEPEDYPEETVSTLIDLVVHVFFGQNFINGFDIKNSPISCFLDLIVRIVAKWRVRLRHRSRWQSLWKRRAD